MNKIVNLINNKTSLIRNTAIYKYTSIEYIASTLENGIYAGLIVEMNDPFESKDIIKPELYRICSFTSSQNAKLMWSHYANSHKGCTIQIEYGKNVDICHILRRVKYEEKYINRSSMIYDNEIVDSLYRKDIKWKNELELRAVFSKESYDPSLWNLCKEKVFLRAKIKAINYGCKTDVNSSEYINSIRAIFSYNQNKCKKIE